MIARFIFKLKKLKQAFIVKFKFIHDEQLNINKENKEIFFEDKKFKELR